MANSDLNFFDKLCECFGNCMTMEQIAKFALTSKVILSYKIDFLSSFHDQLMKGLWKRSSNGCIYPLDNRCEKILYIEINEDYEVNLEKSLEQLRKLSNNIVAQKVFDEVSEPNSGLSRNQTVSSTVENTRRSKNGGIQADVDEIYVSDSRVLQERGVVSCVDQVFDEIPVSITSLNQAQMVRVDLACKTNPSISSKEAMLSSAYQVFDKVSHPVLNTIQDNNALMSYFDNNDEIGVNDECTDGHEDELPLPTFIKEMAQAASIVEENTREIKADAKGLEYPHSPLLHSGSLISGCSFSQVTTDPFLSFFGLENEMFCWGVVNVDHDDLLCGMILEPTCRSQFVFDPGVLFLLSSMAGKDPCLSFFDFKIGWKAKINYKEVHSWGKLYTILGWNERVWSTIWPLHFQYDPVMSSQRVDYIAEVVRLYPSNLQLALLVGIALLFNACELLLVCIGFEEQLTKKWLRFFLKYRYNSFLEIMTTCCNTRWIKLALSCRFCLTLEDKGDFRGEEEKVCVKYNWKLFNVMVFSSNHFPSRTNKSLVLSHVFDPGGLHWRCDRICKTIVRNHMMTWVLWSSFIVDTLPLVLDDLCYGCLRKFPKWLLEIENMNGFGGNGVNKRDEHIRIKPVRLFLLAPANAFKCWCFVFDVKGLKFRAKLSMHFYVRQDLKFTLEFLLVNEKYPCLCSTINLRREVRFDNLDAVYESTLLGRRSLDVKRTTNIDFEEVGNDMGLALWWRMSALIHALICIRNQVATNSSILMTMTCSCLCFDPGGLYNKFCVVILIGLLRVATCIKSTSVWIGCRKDIIFLTLWLIKYLAASSWISDVGTIGFVNFDYFVSSIISNVGALGSDNCKHVSTSFKLSEVLLLGTIEHWFISMRTILVKNSPRKDPTISCKFSLFMILSSLVFDPGGLKYDISLVESLTSKFVQTAAIFLSCCLPQLNLLQSSDWADREAAIVVFDPGGYGNGQKVREMPKACQYGGGKQLKDKRSEDLRIYVFDPGGPFGRLVINVLVTNKNMECAMLCLASSFTCL